MQSNSKPLLTCSPDGPCAHAVPALKLVIPANAIALSQQPWVSSDVGEGDGAEKSSIFASNGSETSHHGRSLFVGCLGAHRRVQDDAYAEIHDGQSLDINKLVPKRPTKHRTSDSASWTPMSLAWSDVDLGAVQVSSLDEYLQAQVLQEAREAWMEECNLRWKDEIRRPLSPVFRRDESSDREGERQEHGGDERPGPSEVHQVGHNDVQDLDEGCYSHVSGGL